jgi:hypothetical protein
MPQKKVVDHEALIEMIEKKTPQSEILEKFKFKNSTQLKVAYVNALMKSKKITPINSQRMKNKQTISKNISVNPKGTLTIKKNLVESMGFKVNDTFEVKKTSSKNIQLKYIPSEAEKTSSHTPKHKDEPKKPKESKPKKTVDNSQPNESKNE